jgi:hopanoid biosynthesis associated RND transporter like protein HpnN
LVTTPFVVGGLGVYTVRNLGIDTDTGRMVNDELEYRRVYLAYQAEFPDQGDELLVLVEGTTPDLAEDATRRLVRELRRDTVNFESVYQPFGGEFFERQALLYMDVDSLASMVDRVEDFADWLRDLERDPTLAGLSATLSRAMADPSGADLRPFLGLVAATTYAATEGRFQPLSWQALMQGRAPTRSELRRMVVLTPRLDHGKALRAGEAVEEVRALASSLDLTERNGIQVRLTGTVAIEHEELVTAVGGVRQAGLLALLMVTFILYLGLRSWRLMAAALATLIVGLVGTSAFAAFAVGDLNLISIAFAVLYIGLGIDYAIHLCLRYRELRLVGEDTDHALHTAVRQIGASLLLSAVTTAACFYAFIPTDFAGVSELGLIGGTGMFVSLLATLTLLPAILHVWPPRLRPRENDSSAPRGMPRMSRAVTRHIRLILTGAGVLTLGAIVLVPRARFNHNPLELRDPGTESIQAYRTLLADSTAKPLTVSVLRRDTDTLRVTAERVEPLDVVDEVRFIEDFVPGEQESKLRLIARLGSALNPPEEATASVSPATGAETGAADRSAGGARASADEARDALGALQTSLTEFRWRADPEEAEMARVLYQMLRRWDRYLDEWPPPARDEQVARLESALVGSLPARIRALRLALGAESIELANLPSDLRSRWIGVSGAHRLEVIPRESLETNEELRRFIDEVRRVVPDVTGAPVSELETARVAVGSFRTALLWALVATAALLLFLLGSPGAAALVVGPLIVAGLWTGAGTVLLGLRFNFANVIALPLLLGVGVDNGIHMVHRNRSEPDHDKGRTIGGVGAGTLATSTARAVLYSTLTTIASFGNLAFATHVGMASMGKLLTIGMFCVLAATLLLLPALLAATGPKGKARRA